MEPRKTGKMKTLRLRKQQRRYRLQIDRLEDRIALGREVNHNQTLVRDLAPKGTCQSRPTGT